VADTRLSFDNEESLGTDRMNLGSGQNYMPVFPDLLVKRFVIGTPRDGALIWAVCGGKLRGVPGIRR
jgi:hypothetical protein